jgi:hypothetical protein
MTLKHWPLLNLSLGFFTLALVVLWRIRALRGGAVIVLRSAVGA